MSARHWTPRHRGGSAIPRIALVRSSELWNQQHVEETHDPIFLDAFEKLVDVTGEENDQVRRATI